MFLTDNRLTVFILGNINTKHSSSHGFRLLGTELLEGRPWDSKVRDGAQWLQIGEGGLSPHTQGLFPLCQGQRLQP